MKTAVRCDRAIPRLVNYAVNLPLTYLLLYPIGSLEQILDENWFPEYNHNHHGKPD
ncbi:MAG: hypothetical protein V7K50_18525 [Nostoc sp.]|uniref:hypothetical protein n=1 Tax=Nostoc sp. TaxID=1180 RepID=UPI002FF89BAD